MGARGPVPKRSEDRIRRNKPEVPIEKITSIGTVVAPPLGLDDPHPTTQSFYDSLGGSAQSQYYEPSDWEYARITMHFVDRLLKNPGGRGVAMLLATVNGMLSNLLVTEGDRRRVRIEVERDNQGGDVVDIAEFFRQRAESA
jgi:hypothetical protein